ncbi:MAG: monooxygenase [Acidimicrobiales bacterium]|jgi:2,6-dihydroxypyridine 3-monooxygenase
MPPPLRVAVAGGSLGGLTAALVLRDLGLDVTIYERSTTELEQRGAGIGFLPASYRYLVERGGCALDDISVVTDRIRYLDLSGAVTHEEAHTYRFSSWNTVYRRLLGCFGRDRYVLGSEVEDFAPHYDVVDLKLAGGRTDSVDLLVCADGITSRSRRTLQPRVAPAYSGYVAWRGMVPEKDLTAEVAWALGDAITYFVYANSHILVYPIPGMDGSVENGERLINFVWYRNYLPGGDLDGVLTDINGDKRETSLPPGAARADHIAELKATAVARLPACIARVVCTTESPFLQVIFDVELEQMAFGHVCLLGDAAWVARPHAAAGTAKAAADAWALGDALRQHDDVAEALTAWEPGQMELGRQLVERTRRIGRRSQVDGTWTPGDPELLFGLFRPGE